MKDTIKLTIELNEENIMGIITELEAKGCYEVAQAIEDSYSHKVAKSLIEGVKKQFKKEWNFSRYYIHSNGSVSAVYANYRNKTFHTEPIYISGSLMGSPMSLGEIRHQEKILEKMGFVEV